MNKLLNKVLISKVLYKISLPILLNTILISLLPAQVQTGEVNYETLGIRFVIPQGWKGQESGEGFIIGHDNEPGMIMLITHNYKNLEQIKQEAQYGFQDQNGTNLQPTGDFEPIGENGIGAEFQGIMQWQQVKFYVTALINPYGYGVTIMSGAATEQFSETHKELALNIAHSVKFSEPETGPVVEEWRQKLTNKRLTYMDSYYSSGSSYGGYSTGGGYSTSIKIDLCSKGYFNYFGNTDVSVDTGGAFGSTAGKDQGNGTWEITGDASGGAILLLHYNNGQTAEYNLTNEEGKTFLNGDRFYVTDGSYQADQAPQCY